MLYFRSGLTALIVVGAACSAFAIPLPLSSDTVLSNGSLPPPPDSIPSQVQELPAGARGPSIFDDNGRPDPTSELPVKLYPHSGPNMGILPKPQVNRSPAHMERRYEKPPINSSPVRRASTMTDSQAVEALRKMSDETKEDFAVLLRSRWTAAAEEFKKCDRDWDKFSREKLAQEMLGLDPEDAQLPIFIHAYLVHYLVVLDRVG
ncbi:hypothetical protein EV359DRAFT_85785 [Lentinula novae-zelandiae]|nr:hypothetical protein EV359DRAFT_85785 [Lentinula novae-zelandiae]